MEKRIDMTKILRVIAMFSLVFFLFACGDVDKVSTATDSGNGDMTSEDAIEEQHRECWQAAVVGTIYKTTGQLTMSMYDKMTQGAMALMMVAFAVWLSFRMLKHMSSFTEESPAEVWTEVIKKFFVCLVCGLLASSTTGVLFVLNSIIFPVYGAFLELGSAMISHVSKYKEISILGTTWDVPFTQKLQMEHDVLCKAGRMGAATLDHGFPAEPQRMMECLTCAINERMNYGIKLGWISMLLPGVMATICGFILVCVFCFVKLGFAFYLVDAIFRFAMMVMILPLLIMSYAFKPTAKWAKSGFLVIVNSAVFMMFIALIMIMIFAATQQVLLEYKDVLLDRFSLSNISVPFIMLLLISFLTVESLGIAQKISKKMVGGIGEANFQKQAGKLLAKFGKKVVTGSIKALAKTAKVVQKVNPINMG